MDFPQGLVHESAEHLGKPVIGSREESEERHPTDHEVEVTNYERGVVKLHIGRGLDNGLSKEEVSEVIMHMAIYGGFPVAVEGMGVAREVFEAAD